jgi:cell division protein FtsL
MVKKFIKIISLFFIISQFICENIKLNKYDDLYNNKIRYLNQKESNKDSSKKNIRDKLSLGEKIIIIVSTALFLILIIILIVYILYKLDVKQQFLKKNMVIFQKHYLFQNIIKEKICDEVLKEDTCSIGINKFILNKSKICVTPCNHIFHFYCLKKYMLDGKGNKCPNCNFNFLEIFNTIKINPSTVEIIPIDEKDNPINYIEEVINNDSNNNKNEADIKNLNSD